MIGNSLILSILRLVHKQGKELIKDFVICYPIRPHRNCSQQLKTINIQIFQFQGKYLRDGIANRNRSKDHSFAMD